MVAQTFRIASLLALAGLLIWGNDCALCHTRIPAPGASWTASQDWIGPAALWKSTPMAWASKDPVWRGKMMDEAQAVPAVEAKCRRCHEPAASAGLADEGVTCIACHRIDPANLGRAESFSGGFKHTETNAVFGPHAEPFTMPMLHHTGFRPTESAHIRESALCATCHTLILGTVVEQAPYLEWLASSYPAAGRSCQSCHVPVLAEEQYIAHRPPGGPFPPTRPRTPFGKHVFAGANAMLAGLMDDAAAATRAEQFLKGALALEVSSVRDGQRLLVTVDAINRAGHKLPTGFPSRRVWLHLRAVAAGGDVLFESGAVPPAKPQPHRELIDRREQVQVFESEYVDANGVMTGSLMAAARVSKDNRIPPAGFDPGRLDAPGLRPSMVASQPPASNLMPGRARTRYAIPLAPSAALPRIEVEALYQTVKPEYAPRSLAQDSRVLRVLPIARSVTND